MVREMEGSVRRMKLGSQGLEGSAQGLGCMGMSAFYGPPKPESDIVGLMRVTDMVALIHHAIQDTSTFMVHLQMRYFWGRLYKVDLASKCGISYPNGKKVIHGRFNIKGDPVYVRGFCKASLKRLQVDELKKLVEEGKIKYIGLSEASASTIRDHTRFTQ